MNKILLVYQDFHPLLTPEETIIHSLLAMKKTQLNTVPLIIFTALSNLDKTFLLLYQGQHIYISHSFEAKQIQGFWTWLQIKDVPLAYIYIQYLRANLTTFPYQKFSTSFLLRSTIQNILSKGLTSIMIDTDHLDWNLDEIKFLARLGKIPEFSQKKLQFYFIVREEGKYNVHWIHSFFHQLFPEYSLSWELVPIDRFYQTFYWLPFFSDFSSALFITTRENVFLSSDYHFYLSQIQKRQIPYCVIQNEISSMQDSAKTKWLIKDYLYHKIHRDC